MAKTLELVFINEDGKTAKISIDNPKEPVDPSSVAAAMDSILTAGVFSSSGGDFVAKDSARLVDHEVTEITLP